LFRAGSGFASNALTTLPNPTRSVAGAIAGGRGKRAIAVN
jgi:hypothetical protein